MSPIPDFRPDGDRSAFYKSRISQIRYGENTPFIGEFWLRSPTTKTVDMTSGFHYDVGTASFRLGP